MKKNSVIKFFASIKLAVVIVLGLATAIAWGTIVEAQFDAERAQKLVYHSWPMYILLGLLCISLIAVMIDRWPWEKKHTGFVLAHIGILILLFGSWVTRKYGVDGSMYFPVGGMSRNVIVNNPEIIVFASLGDSYTNLYTGEHDFLTKPLPPEGLKIPVSDKTLEILEYQPYSLREQKIVASTDAADGPAIRFQLQNPNVNMTEWIIQTSPGREAVQDLGPAKVVLTRGEYNGEGQNAVVLVPDADGESLNYTIYSARALEGRAQVRKGKVKPGDTLETGWMGLVMRILNYYPHAKDDIIFHKRERPTPLTVQAIRIRFDGQERWIGLDSVLKFFTDQAMYLVSYGNRRLDLAKVFNEPSFQMSLQKFSVGRYQGTNRAATYESIVTVPGRGDVAISMNEPLHYKNFTFYQASFEDDPKTGKPRASILSVNYDPGRWLKYLGSLTIVLGTIHLFYFKRRAAAKKAAKA